VPRFTCLPIHERKHWAIESAPHWVLDVAFHEDDCRVCAGNAAENFRMLRQLTGTESTGVFNAVGPAMTMRTLLETIDDVTCWPDRRLASKQGFPAFRFGSPNACAVHAIDSSPSGL